jgi:hypothetical protein
MDDFTFNLPDDAPPDMIAIALLGDGMRGLAAAIEELQGQQKVLEEQLNARQAAAKRKAPQSIPWPLRWNDLDYPAASATWVWLIGWVDWLVTRYQLVEELPACWAQHPAIVEELTALAAGWHTAYDEAAVGDAPLVWHERFARSRARLREWDDYTRCRNGTHIERRLDLDWPADWRLTAFDAAEADVATRRRPAPDPAETGQADTCRVDLAAPREATTGPHAAAPGTGQSGDPDHAADPDTHTEGGESP